MEKAERIRHSGSIRLFLNYSLRLRRLQVEYPPEVPEGIPLLPMVPPGVVTVFTVIVGSIVIGKLTSSDKIQSLLTTVKI